MKKVVQKILVIVAFCLCTGPFGLAQTTDSVLITPEKQWKLEVITPGISVELPIDYRHSFRAKLSILSVVRSAVVLIDDFQLGGRSHLFPILDLQYRRYLNLQKRQNAGKRATQNSGNYIAIKTMALFPATLNNYELDNSFWIAPVWGMQRQMNDKWSLDFAAGLAYVFESNSNNRPFPVISFNMGYLISR